MKVTLTAAAAILMCAAGPPTSAVAGGVSIGIGTSRGFGYTGRSVYRSPGYGYQNVGLRGGYYGGGYYGASPYGFRSYGGYQGVRRSYTPAYPYHYRSSHFHSGRRSYGYRGPSLPSRPSRGFYGERRH